MQLYCFPMSLRCQAVQLTAKLAGVELELNTIDVQAGEQKSEEYLAINPRHSVPTLVDDDLTLTESRAICQYLVNQYAEDDSLYPKDPKTRARIDSLLDFDQGTLDDRFIQYSYPFYMGTSDPDSASAKLEKVQEALGWLDGYLADTDYAVGDQVTIADVVLVATVATMLECNIDLSGYERVTGWLERCQENMKDYEDHIGAGSKMLGELMKSKME